MEEMVVGGDGKNDAEVRSFEQAKSILYGTISKAGAALESASRRRKSTVEAMRWYLDRMQLDVSGLSVIHVTGTKGKGSTCALVESVLRRHGFKTGLFTSPHLLEVTERVRVCGKPISKERFARYFFQVWDRLQTTRRAEAVTSAGGGAEGSMAAADMPTYFHLLTLIGLWCFVQAQVDVCVVEVGMGGRYDATNVVPTPVTCGVAMLDLDHTQVLGDTLDKIALEKGGIFKEHSQAFAVEQPRGACQCFVRKGTCAEEVGCTLEVVEPLPTHDPAGKLYEIGLGGDHQRVNAGLALRLCAAWLKARRQPRQSSSAAAPARENTVVGGQNSCGDAEEGFSFLRSEAVHRGLAECAWPGRCQIYRPPSLPLVTVYLDGAHTEQSMHACLQWFVGKVCKTAATDRAAAVSHPDSATDDTADVEEKQPPEVQQPRRGGGNRNTRCRRVLWFNASHERDVVPLLDMLASARARTHGQRSESYSDDNNNSNSDSDSSPDGLAEGDDAPLFDSAWFMEVPPARPSRVTPPTAQEILAPHGMFTVDQDKAEGFGAAASGGAYASARGEGESGDAVPGAPEAGAGDWQRTLQQVWVALQTRHAGKLSVTQTGSAPDLYANMLSMRRTEEGRGDGAGVVVDRHSVALSGAISADPLDPLAGVGVRGKGGQGNERRRETTGVGMSSGDERIDVLCTGSLYAVAAALEAFGAEVV